MFEGTDSMEGPPTYLKGDIVWVKLSGYWWPGEVINEDDLPSDLLSDFKKPPLVIVKFFEEDSYEYIKHWSGIYPYNCEKKSEFIKKGMAGYRSKLSHLSKFPRDIGTAEEKTNGNPNILSQPEFLPNKKINYDEIFGTPPPKKSTKGKNPLTASKKSGTKGSNDPLITHRRFLGNDDYKAYIWIQFPGKDNEAGEEIEEIQRLNEEPKEFLTCQACNFKTKRLGVMLMHTKMHLNGVNVSTPKRKNKKTKNVDMSDSETEALTVKSPKPKQRKKKETKSKPRDVFTDLLEEWDDTDEETDGLGDKSVKAKNQQTESEKYDTDVSSETQAEKATTNHISEAVGTPKSGKNTQDDIKNCFDFDEEEEEEDFLVPATSGRKIPRVIPEKPRASISELLEMSQKEDDLSSEKFIETPSELSVEPSESEVSNREIRRSSEADETIGSKFKELMEETEVPALDNLSQALKPEQNFHDARTVKFPDKGGTTLKGGTPLKGGTSRKRFVTSFEDFEAGFRKIKDEESNRISAEREAKLYKKAIVTNLIKIDSEESTEQISESLEKARSVPEPNQETIVIGDSLPTHEGKSVEKQPNLSIPEETKDRDVETDHEKKVRRRTKQLVIDEGSEKVIGLTQDDHTGDLAAEAAKITNQLEKEATDTLAAFDAELEAIKKDLEVSPKIAQSTEKSEETTMSLEQLTRELEGSCDSGDIGVAVEPDSQKPYYQKTRRKSKSIGLINVTISRAKDRLRKPLNEDVQSVQLQETSTLRADGAEVPTTSIRRSRSRSIPKELSHLGHPDESDLNSRKDATFCEVEAEKELEVPTMSIRRSGSRSIPKELSHLGHPETSDLNSQTDATIREAEAEAEKEPEVPTTSIRRSRSRSIPEELSHLGHPEASHLNSQTDATIREAEAEKASEVPTTSIRRSRSRSIPKELSHLGHPEASDLNSQTDATIREAKAEKEPEVPTTSIRRSRSRSIPKELSHLGHPEASDLNSLKAATICEAEAEKEPEVPITSIRRSRSRSISKELPHSGHAEESDLNSREDATIREAEAEKEPEVPITSIRRSRSRSIPKELLHLGHSETSDLNSQTDVTIHEAEAGKEPEVTTSSIRRSRSRSISKELSHLEHPEASDLNSQTDATIRETEAEQEPEVSATSIWRSRSRSIQKEVSHLEHPEASDLNSQKGATICEAEAEKEPEVPTTPIRRSRSRSTQKELSHLGHAEESDLNSRKDATIRETEAEKEPEMSVSKRKSVRNKHPKRHAATVGDSLIIEDEKKSEVVGETSTLEASKTTLQVESASEVTLDNRETEAVSKTAAASSETIYKHRKSRSSRVAINEDQMLPDKKKPDNSAQSVERLEDSAHLPAAQDKSQDPPKGEVPIGKIRKSPRRRHSGSEIPGVDVAAEPVADFKESTAAVGDEPVPCEASVSRVPEDSTLEIEASRTTRQGHSCSDLALTDAPTEPSVEDVKAKITEKSSKSLRSRTRKQARMEETSIIQEEVVSETKEISEKSAVDSEAALGHVNIESSSEVIDRTEPSSSIEQIDDKKATIAEPELIAESVVEETVPRLRRGRPRKTTKYEEPPDVDPILEEPVETTEDEDIEITKKSTAEVETPVESPIKLRRGRPRKTTTVSDQLDAVPVVDDNDAALRHEITNKIALEIAADEIVGKLNTPENLIDLATLDAGVEHLEKAVPKIRRGRPRKTIKVDEPSGDASVVEADGATEIEVGALGPQISKDSSKVTERATEIEVGALAPHIPKDSSKVTESVEEIDTERAGTSKVRRGRSRKGIDIEEPASAAPVQQEGGTETKVELENTDALAREEAKTSAVENIGLESTKPVEPVEELIPKLRRGKSRKRSNIEEPVDVAPVVQEPSKTLETSDSELGLNAVEIAEKLEKTELVITPEEPDVQKVESSESTISEAVVEPPDVPAPKVRRGRPRKSTKIEESLNAIPASDETLDRPESTASLGEIDVKTPETSAGDAEIAQPEDVAEPFELAPRRGRSRTSTKIEERLIIAPAIEESVPAPESKVNNLEHQTEPTIVAEDADAKIAEPSKITVERAQTEPEEPEAVVELYEKPVPKLRRGKSLKSSKIEEPLCEKAEEVVQTAITAADDTEKLSKEADLREAKTPESHVESIHLESTKIEDETEPSKEPTSKTRRGKHRKSTKIEQPLKVIESVSKTSHEKELDIPQTMEESIAQPTEPNTEAVEEPTSKTRHGKSRRSNRIGDPLNVAHVAWSTKNEELPSIAEDVAESNEHEISPPMTDYMAQSTEAASRELETTSELPEEPCVKTRRGKSRKSTKLEEPVDITSALEQSNSETSSSAQECQMLSTTEPEPREFEAIVVPPEQTSSKLRRGRSRKDTRVEETSVSEKLEESQVLIQESEELKDTTAESAITEVSRGVAVEETKQSDVEIVSAEAITSEPLEKDQIEAVKTDVTAEIPSNKPTSRRRRGKSRWDVVETNTNTPPIVEIPPESKSAETAEVTEIPETPIERPESDLGLQLLLERSPTIKERTRWQAEEETVTTLEEPSLKPEVPETVSELGPPMEPEIVPEPAVVESAAEEPETTNVSVEAQVFESFESQVQVPWVPLNDQHSEVPSELELKEPSSKLTSKEFPTSTSKGRRSTSRKHSNLDKVVDVELTEKTAQFSESIDDKVELGVEVKSTEKDVFTELPFELIGMLEKRKSSRRYGEKSSSNESDAKVPSKSLLEESSRTGRDRKRKHSSETLPKELKEDNRRSKYHKKGKPDVVEPAQLDSSSQNEELNQRLSETVDIHRERRSSRTRDSRKDKREGRRSRSPKQLVTEDYSRDSRKERERRRRSRSPKKLLENLDRIREDRLSRSRDSRKDREARRRSRSPKQMFEDHDDKDRRKKDKEEKYRSKSHKKSKTSGKPEEPSHSATTLEDLSKQSSEPEQTLQSLSERLQNIAGYTVIKEDGCEVSSPRKTTVTGIVSDTVYGRKSKLRPTRSKFSRWDVVTRSDGEQAPEKDAAQLITDELPKIDDKLSDVHVEQAGFGKDDGSSVLVMTNHDRNKVYLEAEPCDKKGGDVNFEHQIKEAPKEEISKVEAGIFEPSKEVEDYDLTEKVVEAVQEIKFKDSATESRHKVESEKELFELCKEEEADQDLSVETANVRSEVLRRDLEVKFMQEETIEHKFQSKKKRRRSRRSRSITDHISPERDVTLAPANEAKAFENVPIEAESGVAVVEDKKVDSKLDSAMEQENIDGTPIAGEDEAKDISIAEALQTSTTQGTLNESMEIEVSSAEHTSVLNIPIEDSVGESVSKSKTENKPSAGVHQDEELSIKNNVEVQVEQVNFEAAHGEVASTEEAANMGDIESENKPDLAADKAHIEVTLTEEAPEAANVRDVEAENKLDLAADKAHVEAVLTEEAPEAANVGDIEAERKLDFAASHGESKSDSEIVDVSPDDRIAKTEISSATEPVVLEKAVIDVMTDSMATVAEVDLQEKEEPLEVVRSDSSIAPGGTQDQTVAEDLSLTKVVPEPLILEDNNDTVAMNDVSVAHHTNRVMIRYSGAEDLSTKDRIPQSYEEDYLISPPVAAPSSSVPAESSVVELAQTVADQFEDRPLSPKDQIEISSEVAKAIDVLETDLSKEAASDSRTLESSHKGEDIKSSVGKGKGNKRRKYLDVDDTTEKMASGLLENEGKVEEVSRDSTDFLGKIGRKEPSPGILDEKMPSSVPSQGPVDFSGQQTEPQDLSPTVVDDKEKLPENRKELTGSEDITELGESRKGGAMEISLDEASKERRELEKLQGDIPEKDSRPNKHSKQETASEGPVDYTIRHLNEDFEKEDKESFAATDTGGGEHIRQKYFKTSAQMSDQKYPDTHTTISEEMSKNKPSLVDKLKSMPPKKSRWSRRGSYTKKDSDAEQETVTAPAQVEDKPVDLESSVIEKTDQSSLDSNSQENSASSFNDSEIILPPKKSKRVNEVSSQFFSDDFQSPDKKSDADSLCFPSYDDSFMSTTLRNNIEGLIKEIDSIDSNVIPDHLESQTVESDFKPFEMSEVKPEAPSISEHLSANSPISEDSRGGLKESIEIPKGVPPKKKKIELPKDEDFSLPQDMPKSDDKGADVVPQPPKKKIQKLFENSQAIEKADKPHDFLLMSPLAKKKSFLFHHEQFDQILKVEDIPLPQTQIAPTHSKEARKISDTPKESIYSTEVDVDEFLDLPKMRKKRKSLSSEDFAPKKEKLEEDQKSKAAETPLSDITGFSTPIDEHSKPSTSNNEMEVKIEESDFKFNIQTNLSILSTSKAEELSALASKTLSEIKKDVIAESPRVFINTEKPSKPAQDKNDNVQSQLHPPNEPELVPISVTPTVMSEKDLADAQVEITTDKVISEKKPTFPTEHTVKTQPGTTKTTETVGTEFTSKAMVKEFDNRPLTSKPNAYALKSELLDILEGNSNSSTNSSGSEQKFKTSFDNYDKNSTVQGIIDFEEAIPSQIVLSNKVSAESVLMDSPKLLERLSMSSDSAKPKAPTMLIHGDLKVNETLSKALMGKLTKATSGIPRPGQKIVIKTQKAAPKGTKPIILSEQIIRPANAALPTAKAPSQAQGLKRQYEDVEDVETAFIIPKIAKKADEEQEVAPPAPVEKPTRSRGPKISGKAKILQQTIITAKGEVIPQAPSTTAPKTIQLQQVQIQPGQDDAVFDINSMPIVLSDDILTPESIQNMPVVLSEEVLPQSTATPAAKVPEKLPLPSALPKKIVSGTLGAKQIIFKTTQPGSVASVPFKHAGKPRILSTSSAASSSKIAKPTATALLATGTTPDGKPAKYVLVPPSVTPATTQVKSVKQVIKKQPVLPSKLPTPTPAPATSTDQSGQVVGNKIMIVTNAQGQQTRVVLTPQQQKAFMQAQPGSKTKAIIKGAIPKALLESAAAAGPSGVAKTVAAVTAPGSATPVSSQGGLVMPAAKSVKAPVPPKKGVQKSTNKPQKTILIKNQLGQTVRKIQGTDDDDLDRQVAEQLEAIKASARLQQANKTPEIINYTNRQIPSANSRSTVRKSYSKKVDPLKIKIPAAATQAETQKSGETSVPALAPLSPQSRIPQVQNQTPQTVTKQAPSRKVELPAASSSANKTLDTPSQLQRQQTTLPVKCDSKLPLPTPAPSKEVEPKRPESPLRQVVIQDGLGNLTTVTVGQILAIPSETVDGQPQSYMLVTVDESGNLTPLNNDALMSLDPSLGAAGDVNNMMLQMDQGQQGTVAAIKPAESTVAHAHVEEKKKIEERLKPEPPKAAQIVKEQKAAPVLQTKPHEVPLAVEQQIVIGEGVLPGGKNAGGQQLIVTGDPIATQKFLESLSDGSTDLANILANAEGGSVLIQADGQQILIRTNPGAQPMMGITESTEGGGNPIFATHKPNQDILAAALANTDVFQPADQLASQTSPVKGLQPSQLSPGGGAGLYPMHVGNVLETSLTLSSPIMTPLEVPSTNSKKIDDEADILSQVPKNVDLPITITDPNISQTVAHQQAVGLMELALPISETGPSADINSPSYSYSLPTLEESVGISQKSFSSSMPLLTEDVVEVESSNSSNLRVCKGLKVAPSSFSPNFGTLPTIAETIESSREEVVKTSTFGDIESLPMLADDVIEDSGSSVGSTKLPRSSPKPIERDIVDEGLSTLGGEMCSSLSEPPPDMFDLSSLARREEEVSSDMSSIPEPETLSINSENSGEIPIQPPIVATLRDLKRPGDDSDGSDEKRARCD